MVVIFPHIVFNCWLVYSYTYLYFGFLQYCITGITDIELFEEVPLVFMHWESTWWYGSILTTWLGWWGSTWCWWEWLGWSAQNLSSRSCSVGTGLDKLHMCVRDILKIKNFTNCCTWLFFNKYAHEHTFSVFWVRVHFIFCVLHLQGSN